MTTPNAITVQRLLSVRNGFVNYRTPSQSQFLADMQGTRGPVPGYLRASYLGTNVDLSGLGFPGGWADIINQDASSSLDVGIYLSALNMFLPFGQLLPGEGFAIRLHPYLGAEQGSGGGSGSGGSGAQLQLRSESQAGCDVYVGAFDA